MHPQPRPFTQQLFLDFCAIFFPEWPLIFLSSRFTKYYGQVPVPSSGCLFTNRFYVPVVIQTPRFNEIVPGIITRHNLPESLLDTRKFSHHSATIWKDVLWKSFGQNFRTNLFTISRYPLWWLLIRLNWFFHWGKNRNRSNRFFAIYCDLLRFFAIFCDFLLLNQIKHRETTGENFLDLLPSMVSLLGTVESSK